jgi:hypothetical protein
MLIPANFAVLESGEFGSHPPQCLAAIGSRAPGPFSAMP